MQSLGVARRMIDKNGQILMTGYAEGLQKAKEHIYNQLLPQRLGLGSRNLIELEMLQDFAFDQKQQYDSQLISLMNQYKIKCEGEIVTGCVMKFHKLHKRRRYDISEEIRRQFRSICKEFRLEFYRAVFHLTDGNLSYFDDDDAEDEEVEISDLEWIEKAVTKGAANGRDTMQVEKARERARKLGASYYMAAYSPPMHTQMSRSVLYSFPWVVAVDAIACVDLRS